MEHSLFKVLDTVEGPHATFEVLQYQLESAQIQQNFYTAHNTPRQVRITLNNSSVMLEQGALHFMKGHITIDNSLGGAGGMFKKFASSMLTNESTFKPIYKGQGEIYLEPSTKHFVIYQLQNEEIIVDKGMFHACETSVDVGVASVKNFSAAAKGGEGFFQTKLKGNGIAILESPVPMREIIKMNLNNERLQVDGNFAILRTGNIEFTVEKSAKTLLGSATSGEGWLQTFTGTGQVWLAPTEYLHRSGY